MDQRILLAYGSGGELYHRMIDEIFLPAFYNPILARLDDQAIFSLPPGRVAMTTDSFVVDPLFFPGGDIGRLAVAGTVNDLAVGGAIPLYLSAGFIIEEGLPVEMLRAIVGSMQKTAEEAGVAIVTGDTKVVEKGHADKIFINTTGVGVIPSEICLDAQSPCPGDMILVSGFIGDHGIAVMAAREGMSQEIVSDAAPLSGMIQQLLQAAPGVRVMRDPTRGGLATTLNELARSAGAAIKITEAFLPIRPAVQQACAIFGFDPLYVANEGKIVAILPPNQAQAALQALQSHPFGREAKIIGEVCSGRPGRVSMETVIGGSRVVEMMAGGQLPRIC